LPPLVDAALLGIIQGLTEFLPVSSTAHLLIAERLIGFEDPHGVFAVMIQLGSILAIVWLYRAKLLRVVSGLPRDPDAQRFALALFVAFVPALLAGAFLADFVKGVLFESFRVIAVAFIGGGLIMLAIERWRPAPAVSDVDRIPISRAAAVGVCQTLALIPGVSRSGATIIGGLVAGLERSVAAEFSFFLAIPTLTAAFVHSLYEVRSHLSSDMAAQIAVGLLAAFVASLAVIKPFLAMVRRSGFAPFAWYRIALGIAMLAALGLT
jgi:undecaprenyl-diphosphatase